MDEQKTIFHTRQPDESLVSRQSPSSSPASDYKTQTEEPWGHRIENYLMEVLKTCDEKSGLHDDAGYHFKAKKVQWGLPMIIVPALFSPLSLMIGWNRGDTCDQITLADYITAFGFMLTAFFTAVHGFFDYGVKYQVHFNHSYMFGSISSKIKSEMVKHRKFRRQADVFMLEIEKELDYALRSEPILPKSITKKNKSNKLSKRRSHMMLPLPTEPG